MSLGENGLGIGANLVAQSNLHVDGNVILTEAVTIGGETLGNANLMIHGTQSFSSDLVATSGNLSDHSIVFADSTSGNMTLTLPDASSIGDGVIYKVKKVSSNYEVNVVRGGFVDGKLGVKLVSGMLGNLEVVSASGNWHILSISGNAELWSPAETTTVAWYDANDADTVQTSGTTVTSWDDKSGNGYNLDTRSGTPSFDGGPHINGLTAVRFDGSEQLYKDGIPDIDLTNGVCLISAGQGGPGGDWHNWGRVRSTSGNSFLHYRRQGGNPRMTATVRLNGSGAAFNFGNNASSYANDIPFICAVYYDPAGMAYLRGNGGADTASGARDPAATFTINNIHTGRDSNTQGNYHGEMVVIPTYALADIQKLEGYLAWKWGSDDKLPSGHPYKAVAP